MPAGVCERPKIVHGMSFLLRMLISELPRGLNGCMQLLRLFLSCLGFFVFCSVLCWWGVLVGSAH